MKGQALRSYRQEGQRFHAKADFEGRSELTGTGLHRVPAITAYRAAGSGTDRKQIRYRAQLKGLMYCMLQLMLPQVCYMLRILLPQVYCTLQLMLPRVSTFHAPCSFKLAAIRAPVPIDIDT